MAEIQIDEQAFEERYRPIHSETGGWRDFSWAEPDQLRSIHSARAERRLWTLCTGEYDFLMLVSGWHFVNRLGYVITEVPYDSDDDMITVYDPEDLEEAEEKWRREVAEDPGELAEP